MQKFIIVGDFSVILNGKCFRVEKEMLAANSPIFARLINGNPDADQLELHDISEETFKEIIKFMRYKSPPNATANLLELFGASARLEMKELMDLTAGIIMDKITPNNAPDIIKLSMKYGHRELHKKALDELNMNFYGYDESF